MTDIVIVLLLLYGLPLALAGGILYYLSKQDDFSGEEVFDLVDSFWYKPSHWRKKK